MTPMTPMIDIIFQLLVFFILTLQIRETEGKLLNQLPKEVGHGDGISVIRNEVRIILCCTQDAEGLAQHRNNKGRHEAALELREKVELRETKSDAHKKHVTLNDVCRADVDRNSLGLLYKTWLCPRGHREETALNSRKRSAWNKKRYREIAAKAKELYDLVPPSPAPLKRTPVILDTDSSVPYEHIIGIINALKEVEIYNVEFVANARHSKYYGSKTPGQFDSYRQQPD